jgi:hypothetical protein
VTRAANKSWPQCLETLDYFGSFTLSWHSNGQHKRLLRPCEEFYDEWEFKAEQIKDNFPTICLGLSLSGFRAPPSLTFYVQSGAQVSERGREKRFFCRVHFICAGQCDCLSSSVTELEPWESSALMPRGLLFERGNVRQSTWRMETRFEYFFHQAMYQVDQQPTRVWEFNSIWIISRAWRGSFWALVELLKLPVDL